MSDKTSLFQTGQDRYRPDPNHQINNDQDYRLNQRRLARWIGAMAICLPFVLLASTIWVGCMRDSVSHFYFTPFFGDVFVGVMFFIGTFLIAYRGDNKSENWFATLAGIGAFGTALFPINHDGCRKTEFASRVFARTNDISAAPNEAPYNYALTPLRDGAMENFFILIGAAPILHSVFALMLTGFLAYYCFRVFTRVDPETQLNPDGSLTAVKQRRNRFYRIAGWMIVFAIVSMTTHVILKNVLGIPTGIPGWDNARGSFIAEAVAMVAFGISWVIKGRIFSGLDDRLDAD
ncbi:MAG: hypothetical protein AAF826_00130 [Pseudomonadota bacterium]